MERVSSMNMMQILNLCFVPVFLSFWSGLLSWPYCTSRTASLCLPLLLTRLTICINSVHKYPMTHNRPTDNPPTDHRQLRAAGAASTEAPREGEDLGGFIRTEDRLNGPHYKEEFDSSSQGNVDGREVKKHLNDDQAKGQVAAFAWRRRRRWPGFNAQSCDVEIVLTTESQTLLWNPSDPDAWSKVTPIQTPTWLGPVNQLDPTGNAENSGNQKADLIVWKRTTAFPSSRKLCRFVDHPNKLFAETLLPGSYSLSLSCAHLVVDSTDCKSTCIMPTTLVVRNHFLGIPSLIVGTMCGLIALAFVHRTLPQLTKSMSYAVVDFGGRKSIVSTATSCLGVRHPFLGISSLVVGTLSGLVTIAFVIVHRSLPQLALSIYAVVDFGGRKSIRPTTTSPTIMKSSLFGQIYKIF